MPGLVPGLMLRAEPGGRGAPSVFAECVTFRTTSAVESADGCHVGPLAGDEAGGGDVRASREVCRLGHE